MGDGPLLRPILPFRCGLRLPVARGQIQPDRAEIVLADGFFATDEGALARGAYDVWRALGALDTVLPGGLDLGTRVGDVACFPDRTENPTEAFPRTGFGGLVGQIIGVRNDFQTVVNPPQCGFLYPDRSRGPLAF